MNKKIKKRIPLARLRDARLKLDEAAEILEPCLEAVSPPEQQTLVRMGAKSVKFLEVSHELAIKNPELFPSFVKTAFFEEDFFIVRELWTFTNKLNQMRESIRDMEMTAGNNALEAALAFYQTVKFAARRDIPGARVIYEELKPRRPSKRRFY